VQRRIGRAAVAAVACAVGLIAWACDAGSMAGDAMVDAGGMLADAGEAVRDAMGADAAAQDLEQEGTCDVAFTRTTDDGTTMVETTFWYAELRDPSISPDDVQAVRATVCDFEYWGPRPGDVPTCPDGSTCSGAYQAPPLRCRTFSGAEIEEGVVRVFCGNRQRIVGAASSESGSRPGSVRITVVR